MVPQTNFIANTAALTSAGLAGLTWLTTLNDVFQLFATITAIVAGIYAVLWHRARLAEYKRVLRATKMYDKGQLEKLEKAARIKEDKDV